MRMKRKKSKVSKQFRTIWENAGAIFADKPVNAKVPMNEFTIDWTKVNSHFLRNIPSSKQVPVLGCSPDPMFYTDTVHVLEKGTRYEKTEVVKCSFNMDKFPHGYSWGFSTNKGIISAAGVQVHGHIWDEMTGWTLCATQVTAGQVRDTGGQRRYKGRRG